MVHRTHTTSRRLPFISALLLGGLCAACNSDDDGGGTTPAPSGPTSTLNGIVTSGGTDNVVPLPASVDDRIEAVFDRYSQITAPNGRRIHFLSQTGVSDDLVIRTRGLIRQHYFDVPGTTLGADKSAAYNAAAGSGATFVLHTDAASFDPMDADVATFLTLFGDRVQSLDASTIVQEASAEYRQPAPAIDPSIGETVKFALSQSLSSSVSGFQTALTAAKDNAVTNSLYTPPVGTPADEEDDEYLALTLAVYYGIWGHDPNGDGTAGTASEYMFSDRAAMQAGDPTMFAFIEDFFRATHRYSAFLDPTFNGTFEMTFDGAVPYTHRSQYLERVGLRLPSTATIEGNDLDNILLGNTTDNDFTGAGGNDSIEGEAGADRVFMSGVQAEYTVTPVDLTVFRIEDSVMNRDGIDNLRGISQIVFTDATLNL